MNIIKHHKKYYNKKIIMKNIIKYFINIKLLNFIIDDYYT